MGEIVMETLPASWAADVSLEIEISPHDLPADGIVMVPYNIALYQLDEFRMKGGWPVAVPTIDVHARAVTSVTGAVHTHRPHPLQVSTGAAVRWVASEASWDIVTSRWRPTWGYPTWTWESSPEYAPTYTPDYSYRFGKEVLIRDCLNFSDDAAEHLWSVFTGSISSSARFSMILVLSLTSRYSLNLSEPSFSGIIAPGGPTPGGSPEFFAEEYDGSTFGVQLRSSSIYANANSDGYRKLFSVAQLMERTNPSYLGITHDGEKLTTYMGTGPSSLQYASLDTTMTANNLNLVIGRSTGSLKHCADMALFDVSFYLSPLDKSSMVAEIARLSSSYGGA